MKIFTTAQTLIRVLNLDLKARLMFLSVVAKPGNDCHIFPKTKLINMSVLIQWFFRYKTCFILRFIKEFRQLLYLGLLIRAQNLIIMIIIEYGSNFGRSENTILILIGVNNDSSNFEMNHTTFGRQNVLQSYQNN